ncbi:MAG: Gfo/Idh/MocA family oxidoreductase [Clostridiales bacterium]|nr:Gfo/Idh/MocA family oxidoreductase [Clostridiales bacterium]
MKDGILRYGVIGCGRGAAVAACGFNNPNCRLIAACDHNKKVIDHCKEYFESLGKTDVIYLNDYDEMLKMDIDAVIVATEAVYHVPIVEKAMNAGKHVLSEIPSITNVDEAYKLKKIVADHPDCIYMAAENCCYWAFIQTWKTMRENGDFGDIVFAEAEYLHSIDPAKFAPDNYPKGHWRTYNPAIKYCTHELGPLLYIMDDRCVSVSCMNADIEYNPYFPQKNATSMAVFKTEKGAIIRLLVSFGAYTSYDHNYRLSGTKGTIETDRREIVDNAHSLASLSRIPGTFSQKIDIPVTSKYLDENGNSDAFGHGGADSNMFADFVKCVIEGKKPELDVDFGIKMSLPGIIAALSAEQNGAAMEIPDIK